MKVCHSIFAVGCALLATTVSVVVCTTQVARAADPAEPAVSAISKPSDSRKLSFPGQGIISNVSVKDGDEVKTGQVLMTQDIEVDQIEAERYKVEAESMAKIKANEADLEVKKIQFKRKADAPNGFSPSEIEEAKLNVIVAEQQLANAQDDQKTAQLKYQSATKQVEKKTLQAKFDGIVQQVVLEVGEWFDPQNKDGALTIVKVDPLWIEIRDLTTRQVATLHKGDELQVRYVNGKPGEWQAAKVIYITPTADAGSDRQLVRLELSNPDFRAAGQRMVVKLTKALIDSGPKDETVLSGQ